MSEVGCIICYEVQNLTQVSVYVSSAFTPPAGIADVNGIRMLFQTVNSVNEAAEATGDLLAWFEYEVGGASAVINGITYAVGSTVLLANDTTPPAGSTFTATGRYGQYISDTLPLTGAPYEFTPSQTGRTAYNSQYFADEVFTLNLEQYQDIYEAADTLAAGTYLCVGTAGQSVLIAGTKTVYVGETYTSSGSETFTGTPNLILFEEEGVFNFATIYQSFIIYQRYLSAKAVAVNPDTALDSDLLVVASLFASPTIAAQIEYGIDLTQLQDNLDRIINYYGVQTYV